MDSFTPQNHGGTCQLSLSSMALGEHLVVSATAGEARSGQTDKNKTVAAMT